ncbi:MAG: arylsulfatase [Dehalococcoidia bacterium]
MPEASELTFFHTSQSHVERFELLRTELAPQTAARHVVHESLLARAVSEGWISSELRREVEQEVAALASGSRVVLCTCSTLGAIAEQVDGVQGARVVRLDRPMARNAVRAGTRVAIIASVESTVASTVELLEQEAQRAGRSPEFLVSVAEGAWERFLAGDQEGYLKLVADCAKRAACEADVVVLAQASMHGAERFTSIQVPVLASPMLGLEYALELLAAARNQG